MRWSLYVCLCLSVFVRGEDEEDEICACVDPPDCVNGVVRDGLPTSSINFRQSHCDGVKSCCSLPPGASAPAIPSSSPQPHLGNVWVPDVETPTAPSNWGSGKKQLPRKAPLQGCGVRRFNGSQPKINENMVRINPDDPENEKLIETFYGELPWLVRVLVDGKFECGGSLISNQVVLTAAHCIDGKSVEQLSVIAGDWNATADIEAEPPQKRSVVNVAKHEKFKMVNGENDIALLFTDTPFQQSLTVDTICYPESHKYVNQNECFSAGWGKGQEHEKDYSPVLRKIHMPILDRTRCQKQFQRTSLGPNFVLLPGFMCAGGTDNRDTCKGDGGGPLYCTMLNEPNRFSVIGVISWGIDCGKGNPTVCASVPYYYSWISKQLQDWPNFRKST